MPQSSDPSRRMLVFRMPKRGKPRTCQILGNMSLRELRCLRKISQKDFAAEMRASQSEISRVEKRRDVHVSTLRDYIEALGGHLKIVAMFPTGSYIIDQFHDCFATGNER
jgi:predicted transcriptional regulator